MGRRLDPDTLSSTLEKTPIDTLGPLFVVSGDEPLLVIETTDALRAAATTAGYTDRSQLTLDARGDWSSLLAALQTVSLFGDRRLITLSIPGGKPGKTGGETLQKVAELVNSGAVSDTLLVVSLPRLDKTTRSTKWANALFEAAATLEVRTVERNDLPGWISRRLARQNQSLSREALEWMADNVEGNLLAAFQEIQKLALLYPQGQLSAEEVQRAVLNVARYDVFGLRDAMLAGQAKRALTILWGLKAEGEALPLVFWAVGDEVRTLCRLAAVQAAGGDLGAELRRQRAFGSREQGLRQTLARVPVAVWPTALQHAHDIDRLIKGLKVPGRLPDPWEELARLTARIALGRTSKNPQRQPVQPASTTHTS
jgi:DNA polymerase-3 subunit delta